MKLFFLLITTLLFTSSAFSQMVSCLGFPSADKFECLVSDENSTREFTVNIPAGFGCMQKPISGTITYSNTDVETIYSPSSYFVNTHYNGHHKHFSYYPNSDLNESEKIDVGCDDFEPIK